MHSLTKKTLSLAAALSLIGGYAMNTQSVRAEDMTMPKDKGMMMDGHGDMMKKMVSDPANAPTADDLAKAKAMHEMVTDFMKDPDCQKMCMTMSSDPKMMPTDDAVKAAKDAMMKDPAMVRMAMAHAMVMNTMPGMGKSMGMEPKMDHDMSHDMDKDKSMGMDHGQTGGMTPAK